MEPFARQAVERGSNFGGVVDPERRRRNGRQDFPESDERRNGNITQGASVQLTNGFWRDAEWIYCRDGKYRPVEPGTFPLASGITNRVGRLRGYGNALCSPQAQAFIESYMSL
jgi:DNA (cytosine-5)-methyltransferase 1